jgi:S-sulfo-L-cysteine synthase (O-acetyl-L-serine-dependent)
VHRATELKGVARAAESPGPQPVGEAAPVGQSLLARIGHTPLLRLDRISAEFPAVQILGKAEWLNPGGSVKDRAAAHIVAESRASGEFAPGKVLLDATSGNTGIAFAMLGAAQGFPVTLCMPGNVSAERKKILDAYGAEVVYTDPAEGSDGAILKARELYAAYPERYYYADQYSNPANWRAHYHSTAAEIWQQTQGRVTHFVSILGTTGTFVGTSRRLKELNPGVACISVQPDSPLHGIEGAKHLPSALVPKIWDPAVADQNMEIATETAYDMVKRLAREEGLLVGISAGAAVAACVQVAERLVRRKSAGVIVTVLPDSAMKYLSERFWEE